MAAATAVPLSDSAQKSFLAYYNAIQLQQNSTRQATRAKYEVIDKNYQREVDNTQAQLRAHNANKAGDPNRFQNMTVPVVMPQVETATTYQSSVFLTGYPLFGAVSSPQFADEALQLETILEADSRRGGWTRQLMLSFRDGFKYNFAPVEVSWATETTQTNITTDIARSITEGIPTTLLWAGNKITRLDPYNTFVDPKVAPTEVYKHGEYAGYTEVKSRIALKAMLADMPNKLVSNVVKAFQAPTALSSSTASGNHNYYVPPISPTINPDDYLHASDTNWLSWAGLSSTTKNTAIDYKNLYEVTTLYCKVLPAEFDQRVANSNTPQIYKLVIVNHSVIVYAELQTNAHNYLPVLIGQPLEDGLGYQTKSLASNAMPYQALASSYMNSIIASRRRAISDRTLYDPSRVSAAAINSPNPSAKIPVRPGAYGKDISQSVYAFPYREDQAASSMQQIQTILGLANQLSGQNQASQGQFVKGNKTLQEFDSVMNNANGRDQMVSILLESQLFSPMKEILKINILQYKGGDSIYNRDANKVIEVDPLALRKAVLDFKITDGLTPASKMLNSDSFSTALQVIGSSPQIGSGYNIAPLFSYLMKTQGANLAAFEKSQEQQAYEQAVNSWQQLALEAINKGTDLKTLPPQPLPEAYGYDPAANNPSAPAKDKTSTPNQPAQPTL